MSTTTAPDRRKRSSRKRGGGSRRKRGGGGQLQLHQTKVTFRNISVKFETAKQILIMISEMIDKVNEESKLLPIKLEAKSIERIVKIEEMVAAEQAKQQTTPGEESKSQDVETKDTAGDSNDAPHKTMADIVAGLNKDSVGPFIAARVLYVVPPKSSRRRGVKNGCAYLVFTPPPPPPPTQPKVGDTAGLKIQEVENDSNGKEDDTTADSNAKQKSSEEPMDQPAAPQQYNQAERSRLTAIAKLQLIQSIEALAAHAEIDAKSEQVYGECQVEASTSGKAWRDKESGNRDRREGTIENTSDYKQFFNKQSKALEERQSRPKPAPGGGSISTNGENGENEEKLSAIVMHLRAKHKEQNQRKKAKKKANKEAKKGSKSQASGSTTNNSNRDSKNRTSSKGGSGGARGKSRRENSKNKSGSGVKGPVVLMKTSQNG
mmetsp:Transcript_30516/g.45160  ORF Transcript_30516/g.45160 Transcript_30516/m.45160 type:complete len:433 (+) Transcript_30516:300-1598(+)|eukprot:CAMPEP_0194224726 /NCGR_PEP_ID=MMETSP0156-20130528/38022_1 /TAXON_ID=33649 /ORGANISM="Thalassionema nitzschioides, Strain L26-B" /LENGTH=432 /DNA_ID=CAMNT_0038956411 /DNA_START=302 /DNA_END=1600 /DNA_ORIENTATION=+